MILKVSNCFSNFGYQYVTLEFVSNTLSICSMRISEEKRIIVESRGFLIRINAEEINEMVLESAVFTLEVICNVPILILQFPKPYQVIMIPVELTKNIVFDNIENLSIRLELTGDNAGIGRETQLSKSDSEKIRQCCLNLPKQLHFGRTEGRERRRYSGVAQ